ncbi:Multi-sensor signal transduction histidine kinase [Candidatus Methylomirabilis lanthanidiphila]|uniref:histidine kinase n=1 Tax=Candidatus Methylomirabilis lanthanidiphila TaxID=2211376 RepID=A0A564ZG79_9BACT|nr:PAS domain S-box protein [Candidatus Methylomirabilis lanthanidiphila]VUZ83652.1 Multi-sensor signal transduction histidine kinase [Candidatus Methylomirabilis lanthanidiphila]
MTDTNELSTEDAALSRQIKWLIGLRLLVAFLFLGSAGILALREHPPLTLTPLFVLTACACLLSILYLLALSRTEQLAQLCGLQIWIDVVLVTALVHYTGGLKSLFAFVYVFPVLAAAILLSRRSSLLLAGGSTILYGTLIDLQIYGLTQRAQGLFMESATYDPVYALLQLFVNSATFFLVALLGSRLAERLKETGRELEAQRIDLRNLRTLHEDIIENIPSGVVTLDLDGKIVSFNRGAQKIIGATAEQIRDKSWRETPFKAIEGLETFFSVPTSTLSEYSQELAIRNHVGQSIPIGINLTPLKSSDGRLVGLVGIFQDLTERKKSEARLRQADRLATAGQMAAGLAHEVRNPLAAISGCIELIKEQGTPRPQLFEIVLREAERLKLVTGQFLDFAKPTPALQKQCNLGTLVTEAVSLLEKSCDSTHPIIFSIEREAEEMMAVGDPDQLRQALWNLGLNAIQAMQIGGQLSFAIRRYRLKNTGDWVAIELTDTGPGISPEEVERIFDPFYTTRPGGTGLGLTITQKIVDNLGGRIEVISQKGGGSTFRVLLKPAPCEEHAVQGVGVL